MKKKQYLCTRFQKMGLNLPPESEVTVVTARIAELETDRRYFGRVHRKTAGLTNYYFQVVFFTPLRYGLKLKDWANNNCSTRREEIPCRFEYTIDSGAFWALSGRTKIVQNNYNEEFDPGSGWTLATGLTHASRGAARGKLAFLVGDRRTGE